MRPLTSVQMGTLGGTFCSIWVNLNFGDVVQTIVMATIGAAASYVVSHFLNRYKK